MRQKENQVTVDIDGRTAQWSPDDGFTGDEGIIAAAQRALLRGGEVQVLAPNVMYRLPDPADPDGPAAADVAAALVSLSGRAEITPGDVLDEMLPDDGPDGDEDDDVVIY